MTYGEAHTAVKFSLRMVDGNFVTIDIPSHDKQMSRQDATKYYSNKAKKVFESLGYKCKERELVLKDFDCVDDYFDYFEASRLKAAMQQSAA